MCPETSKLITSLSCLPCLVTEAARDAIPKCTLPLPPSAQLGTPHCSGEGGTLCKCLLFFSLYRFFLRTADLMDISLWKLQEMVKVREAWYDVVHGVTNSHTGLSN